MEKLKKMEAKKAAKSIQTKLSIPKKQQAYSPLNIAKLFKID